MAMEKFEVVGPLAIRDSQTKVTVPTGGTVTLDTEKILISALIEQGAVKPLSEAPKGRKD